MIDRLELEKLGAAMTGEAMNLGDTIVQDFPDWGLVAGLTAKLIRQRKLRVIAISGSQGSGKSTLAASLVKALAKEKVRASAVSIDDFYLSKQTRADLASNVHPLLATRGVPGTHDHVWLTRILENHLAGQKITVPRFDKASDDRSAEEEIHADCLILEGWCVGVTSQESSAVEAPINALEADEDPRGIWRHWVNTQISHYTAAWEKIEFWLHLRVPDFDQVYEWRAQQESKLAASHRMNPRELRRFIQHYERLTRHLWNSPYQRPGLKVELNALHRVSAVQALD